MIDREDCRWLYRVPGSDRTHCQLGRYPELDCASCPAYNPMSPPRRDIWTEDERSRYRRAMELKHEDQHRRAESD